MDNRLTAQQWTSRDGEALDRGRPSRLQAEEAVRTLISWAGDDPTREGLLDTPERVARAYEEWFAGYNEVPSQLIECCFEEIAGYDEIVLLRDIRFESHCEHHVAPIIGCAQICLFTRPPRGRYFETRASCPSVRSAAANSGENDGGDRANDRSGAQTARRRGGD